MGEATFLPGGIFPADIFRRFPAASTIRAPAVKNGGWLRPGPHICYALPVECTITASGRVWVWAYDRREAVVRRRDEGYLHPSPSTGPAAGLTPEPLWAAAHPGAVRDVQVAPTPEGAAQLVVAASAWGLLSVYEARWGRALGTPPQHIQHGCIYCHFRFYRRGGNLEYSERMS